MKLHKNQCVMPGNITNIIIFHEILSKALIFYIKLCKIIIEKLLTNSFCL